jgi:hypothetical protein
MSTCYAHQERFAVSMGQHVAQGQVIGYSDCTGRCFGPHLHFEVRINNVPINPVPYFLAGVAKFDAGGKARRAHCDDPNAYRSADIDDCR